MSSFKINRVGVLHVMALTSLLTALALASPALSKSTSSQTGKPHVSTGGLGHAHESSAQLTGLVNPNGLATGYDFQYGPTTAYGSQTPTVNLAAGTTAVKVGQTVNGLLPGYHYRLVASNADGQSVGKDRTLAVSKKRLRFVFAKIKGRTRLAGYRGVYILSGTLTGIGNGNHPLVLQANPYPYKGTFTTVVGSTALTNAAGGFSFRISQLTQSTKFRVEALDTRPSYSAGLIVYVAVNVTIHVRAATKVGLARVYGTVAPATVGTVIVQVLKAAKETGKREATGPRAVTVGTTKLKRATATVSRFSVVLRVPSTARYRVYVRLAKGPLVSGYSPHILIRTSVTPAKGKKGKAKTKG